MTNDTKASVNKESWHLKPKPVWTNGHDSWKPKPARTQGHGSWTLHLASAQTSSWRSLRIMTVTSKAGERGGSRKQFDRKVGRTEMTKKKKRRGGVGEWAEGWGWDTRLNRNKVRNIIPGKIGFLISIISIGNVQTNKTKNSPQQNQNKEGVKKRESTQQSLTVGSTTMEKQ